MQVMCRRYRALAAFASLQEVAPPRAKLAFGLTAAKVYFPVKEATAVKGGSWTFAASLLWAGLRDNRTSRRSRIAYRKAHMCLAELFMLSFWRINGLVGI